MSLIIAAAWCEENSVLTASRANASSLPVTIPPHCGGSLQHSKPNASVATARRCVQSHALANEEGRQLALLRGRGGGAVALPTADRRRQ